MDYAFIHIQKTAGTYVDALVSRTLIQKGYRIFNPWYMSRSEIANIGHRTPPFDFTLTKQDWRRDWSEQEILTIAQLQCKKYIHNHGGNWTQKIWDSCKEDFFFFSFMRNPVDLMCSMYFFLQEKPGEPSDPGWGSQNGEPQNPRGLSPSLESFFQEYWMFLDTLMPPFYREINYLRIFSEESLRVLIEDHLGGKYSESRKLNTSGNLGFEHYLRSKELSEDSVAKIQSTEMYKLYKELE